MHGPQSLEKFRKAESRLKTKSVHWASLKNLNVVCTKYKQSAFQ